MFGRYAALASAAALALFGFGTSAHAEGTKIFKAWMAACDNVAVCSAYGFEGGGEAFDFGGYVMIHRAAGPEAPLQVSFIFPVQDAAGVDGQTWGLVLDGVPLDGFGDLAVRDVEGQAWRADLSPARSQAFIDAVRNGDDLVLTRGGDQIGQFSLAGVTATLLWFDETQDRIGTTSAIIRKGGKTAPAAAAAPVVARGPATSQEGLPTTLPKALAARAEIKACEAGYATAEDLTVARLSPGTLLWAVPCSRGAYNTIFAMMLTDEAGGQARRALFPGTPGAGEEQAGELMNISYDPATRILSNFDKARGIGDCGAASDWVWTGKAFVLVAQSLMPDCRGVSPDHWPSIWKAEVR